MEQRHTTILSTLTRITFEPQRPLQTISDGLVDGMAAEWKTNISSSAKLT
jgi:hypothetical protein